MLGLKIMKIPEWKLKGIRERTDFVVETYLQHPSDTHRNQMIKWFDLAQSLIANAEITDSPETKTILEEIANQLNQTGI